MSITEVLRGKNLFHQHLCPLWHIIGVLLEDLTIDGVM